MVTADLITRAREKLESNSLYFEDEKSIVLNALNPALLLLALMKPALLVKKTTISVLADECFLDLRVSTPRCLKIDRVSLGDVTGETPIPSQGELGDLRVTSLPALRSKQSWLMDRRHRPQNYARHGVFWLILYPRSILDHTITIVYRAFPAPLDVLTPNVEPELPQVFHDVLPEIASNLALMMEGGKEAEMAMQRLAAALGQEKFEPMLKAVGTGTASGAAALC